MNARSKTYLPFDQISKLEKLKALQLVTLDVTTSIDDSLCNLYNLQCFIMRNVFFNSGNYSESNSNSNSNSISNIPSCIGTDWQELKYIELALQTDTTTSLTVPNLFQLPNIQTILIISWDINATSFDHFSHASKSLDTVSFSTSNICEDIMVNNTYYATYLEYIADVTSNSDLQNFIDNFVPCFEPCPSSSNTLTTTCTGLDFGDGICDDRCFSKSCDYDKCMCANYSHSYNFRCIFSFVFILILLCAFCILCSVYIYDTMNNGCKFFH